MLLEFTVELPDGSSFKERVEVENEAAGIAILEAKYVEGCCPYPCKVIFVPPSA
jgi:hypothetical protein